MLLPPGLEDLDGFVNGRPAWQRWAACVDEDRELFFPPQGQRPDEARRICSACPVAAECLDYALAHDLQGVWAGTSRSQRRRMARQAA